MIFEQLKPEYDQALAKLIRHNLKQHGLDVPGTVYFDEGLEHLSGFYLAEPEKRDYFVLTDAGEVVGGIGLAEFEPFENCAELQKLYLADRVKGRGLGYELIKLVEKRATELGYKQMYLETHTNLEAARHIYEKSGYQLIDRPDAVVHGTMNRFYLKQLEDNAMNLQKFTWTREPRDYKVLEGRIEITTAPHTDLWQRTYYHFRNDNAPVCQMETDEKFFSFTVRTDFEKSHHRFDQCGIVMYLDSENWLKASVEYENEAFQHLGSVVTNHGYSDWATTAIPADVKTMWYRFSRREDDYCIECSRDGKEFSQMRICHMWEGAGKIRFGIYACSPEDSSFTAVFSDMNLGECVWKAHVGQAPDEE